MNSLINPARRLPIALLPIGLLSLSLVSSLGSTANAATFTRVLQTGQAVPGNNQPVSEIRSIAIDNQKSIVAIVSTPTVTFPGTISGGGGSQTFQGFYLFNSALVPTLVDTAESFTSSSNSQSAHFITASLNAGTTVVLRSFRSQSRISIDFGRTEVKVGPPGALQVFLTANRLGQPTLIATNTLALTNGAAFLLGEPMPQTTASPQKGLLKTNAPGNLTEAIAVTDPIFGSEPFAPRDSGQIVRSSGNNLLLVTQNASHYRVFKKSGTAATQQIYNGTTSTFDASSSCGAAISGNNIVLCAKEVKPTPTGTNPYSLRVKFGNAAPQTIPLSNTIPIEQPSIAGRTVIFKAVTPTQDKLYVSTNAKAPVQILATGDALDGKIVSKLNLSEQGQAIVRTTSIPMANLMVRKPDLSEQPDLNEQNQAVASATTIVFLATFTDGSVGLYRGTL